MTTKHVNLRLSPEMHNNLVDMAERKRRSMNGQVEVYIEEGLARDGLNGSADPFRAPVAAKSPTATELAGMLADAMDRWPEAFGPRARDMAEDVRFVLLGIGNRTDTTGEPA